MEVEPNIVDIFRKYKEEYKTKGNVRTHQDSFGNVYDMRNISEEEEHVLYKHLFKTPGLCFIEAVDTYSKSKPFLDIDSGFDAKQWQLFTTISRKLKLQSVIFLKMLVLCNEKGESYFEVQEGSAHIIFNDCKQKQNQEYIHRHFLDGGLKFDTQCKISLRYWGQYKRLKDGSIKRECYYPVLFFLKQIGQNNLVWFQLKIKKGDDNEFYSCASQKPWTKLNDYMPDIDESEMMSRYEVLQLFSIRCVKKNINLYLPTIVAPTDNQSKAKKLEDVRAERFLCGAYTELKHFDRIQIFESIMSMLDAEGPLSIIDRNFKIVDYLNKHIAFVAKIGTSGSIVYRSISPVYHNTIFQTMAREAFLKLVNSLWVLPYPTTKNGEPIPKAALKELKDANSLFNIWEQSEYRKSFIDMTFSPSYGPLCKEVPVAFQESLNTYSGLAYTLEQMKFWYKKPNAKAWARKFNDYIFRVICDKNWHLFAYVLQFVNYCVKYPGKNLQTMLYIQGGQGTGKSLFTTIIYKLFGPHAYIVNTFDEILNGGFNAHLSEAVLCICDEFKITTGGSCVFKSRITSEVTDQKKKFEQNKTVANCNKYIATGNKSIHELAKIVKSGSEAFTRRVVAININPEFNRLTNRTQVEKDTEFMFRPTCLMDEESENNWLKSDPVSGAPAWLWGFFADDNVGDHGLFSENSLNKWEAGRQIPTAGNVTVSQNVENSDENILLKYLAYKFNNQDYCLSGDVLNNPLILDYWPDQTTWKKYPERVRNGLNKVNKKFVTDCEMVEHHKTITVDHKDPKGNITHRTKETIYDYMEIIYKGDPFQQVVCLELIKKEIEALINDQYFIVSNPKKENTVEHLKSCFKELTKKDCFVIPIPPMIIDRMSSATEKKGEFKNKPTDTETTEYTNLGSTASKNESKWTFLDLGDKESFLKSVVHARNVMSEDLKEKEKGEDDSIFERLYGKHNVEDFVKFYDDYPQTPDTPGHSVQSEYESEAEKPVEKPTNDYVRRTDSQRRDEMADTEYHTLQTELEGLQEPSSPNLLEIK